MPLNNFKGQQPSKTFKEILRVSSSNAVFDGTGSLVTSLNITASNALTASYLSGYVSPFPYTGSARITGSLGITGSLNVNGGITGSLFGTSSYATQALSASYASNILGGTNGYIPLWSGSTALTSSIARQISGALQISGSVNITGSLTQGTG